MKRIVYEKQDGSIAVVIPVVNTFGEKEGFTEDDALQRAWKRLPDNAINPRVVDPQDIPVDRTFRNAWISNGMTITHDMNKCREIHRNKMRLAREQIFKKLDVEYQKADEAGDLQRKSDIAMQKQKLRDVTNDPLIESTQTPEELKSVWPDILK